MNELTLRPEILTHPNIPKPLHGLSPRTIKGQIWWDTTREEIYKSTDYHCIACGIEKLKAKKNKWLEAHEFWNINYQTGICKVESIVPLCHYCHNFIHSGRLAMIINKEKSEAEVIEILEHGFSILKKNKLKAFMPTIKLAEEIGARTFNVKGYTPNINNKLKWSDFILVFEDVEYKSKFGSIKDWKNFYDKI
jgi:hypothetical protein